MSGNVLQISFVIGFALALGIYIAACFAGKKTPQLRISVLVVGCIVFAVGLWPFPWNSASGHLIRFGIMYFVCLTLINGIIKNLGSLTAGLYPIEGLSERIAMTNKVIIGLAICFFLICAFVLTQNGLDIAYGIVLNILFACLGLLLALKLLKK